MSSTSTKIEWTERTWNPVRGCSLVSPGCTNCYAMGQAHRFSGAGKPYEGLTRKRVSLGPVWTGEVRLVREALGEPLSWRKPSRVFVNSMSDLFHEGVPDGFITDVWRIMFSAPQHTFQVLTKRPERARSWLAKWTDRIEDDYEPKLARGPAATRAAHKSGRAHLFADMIEGWGAPPPGAAFPTYDWAEGMIRWPNVLRNVWLGVSVEDRKFGLPRIAHLRATPAAVRFLSIEPLLEDLGSIDLTGISWVIVGGESGHGARRCDVRWIRNIVAQCREQGVAVFVKQLGAFVVDRNDAGFDGACEDSWPEMDPDDIEHDLDGTRDDYQGAPVRVHLRSAKGGDPEEWPLDLRVREMPGARS